MANPLAASDRCSVLDKRTNEPPGSPPPPDTHIPSSQGILTALVNPTNSRFFTDCYSDSDDITPSTSHMPPGGQADLNGSDKSFKLKCLQKHLLSIQVGLPAQKGRDIELIFVRLWMRWSGATVDIQPLWRSPLGEFRGRIGTT
jgi:hypothetical protein